MNLNEIEESRLHGIELPSRRRFLRRAFLSAAGLPLLGAPLFWPGRLLAATEESPETENNWEGPFYKPGAPVRSVLIEKGTAGTPLTVTGRVFDTRGRALKGALLDIWHADHTGTYDNRGFRLRGKLYTDDEGRYTLRTIKPLYYGDPDETNARRTSMSKPAPVTPRFSRRNFISRATPGTTALSTKSFEV